MTKYFIIIVVILAGVVILYSKGDKNMEKKNFNDLSEMEKWVIEKKGTEKPYSGKFNDFNQSGFYTCKKCDAKLYKSDSKFNSGCGWPSFDDEIKGAVKRITDKDGRRLEIVCANCGGHLGHIFSGEGFTAKNSRHCVNSISLNFSPLAEVNITTQKAYFAGGCFWGIEYHFEKLDGVQSANSGYMGGRTLNPTYEDICYKDTGHLEVVEVVYDPARVGYETLAKLFFEIHNPTQANGQGPDIGSQYLSAVFYNTDEEKNTTLNLIATLEKVGYKIATKLMYKNNFPFYKAEDYHQNYYQKTGKQPYCHKYTKRF